MTLPRQHHPLCASVNDAAPCDCGVTPPETDWLSIAVWVMLGFAIAAVVGLNLDYWLHA